MPAPVVVLVAPPAGLRADERDAVQVARPREVAREAPVLGPGGRQGREQDERSCQSRPHEGILQSGASVLLPNPFVLSFIESPPFC